MTDQVNATVGCQLVGEYVDEAECPADVAFHQGEVIRPHIVANSVDLWDRNDGVKEFTVLLNDGRTVAVRGHNLKHSPHPVAGQDVYSIVSRTAGEEMLVALFKGAEVAGIFHGELLPERKIA